MAKLPQGQHPAEQFLMRAGRHYWPISNKFKEKEWWITYIVSLVVGSYSMADEG
jgi:hypothetical protein